MKFIFVFLLPLVSAFDGAEREGINCDLLKDNVAEVAHTIMFAYKEWNMESSHSHSSMESSHSHSSMESPRSHSSMESSYSTPGMNMSEYVRFFLYTKKNSADWQELWIQNENSIKSSNFNSSKPTFFVIHGYLNDVNSDAIQLPKKSLLDVYDCNVIAVDWSRISVTLIYSVAFKETPHVGHFLAEMIKYMASNNGLDAGRTHLIGHSLGAHVAGFAGKNLKDVNLARITGLDPAKPGFTGVGPTNRLNATDAAYVDCIHTCAGDLGLDSHLCQADYYPNGGTNPQPGCLSIDFIGTCSHERSVSLYAESVYPNHVFQAKQCPTVPDASGTGCVDSPALMGQLSNSSFRGIFYVETRGNYPFAEIVNT